MKILTVILCLISSYAFGQIKTNQIDPVTTQKTKQALVKFGKSYVKLNLSLSLKKIGQEYSIVFIMGDIKMKLKDIDSADYALKFKFKSDSTMIIKAGEGSSYTDAGASHILTVQSKISSEQLKYFANNDITDFTIAFDSNNGIQLANDYMFTPKNRKEVKKAADYILED